MGQGKRKISKIAQACCLDSDYEFFTHKTENIPDEAPE
jgi:hypothetical protein